MELANASTGAGVGDAGGSVGGISVGGMAVGLAVVGGGDIGSGIDAGPQAANKRLVVRSMMIRFMDPSR